MGRKVLQTKHYFEELVNNSLDMIISVDKDRNIVIFNPAAEKTFGYTKEEVTGKHINILYADPAQALQVYERVKDTNKFEAEVLNKKKDGSTFIALLSSTLLHDENGNITGLMGISRDITEYKNTEEKLRRANIRLQEHDNMKTEFLSIVSHELRTPLSLVLGFTKIISKRLRNVICPHVNTENSKVKESLAKIQKDFDTIEQEGRRLTVLIDDLLDITKIEAGKVEWDMKPVSVAEVVVQAIALAISTFEQKGLELIKDFEEELPRVLADKDRLKQVVMNLISNALKFTDKGTITCSVRRNQCSEIVVSVIDTGIGIEDADRIRIFEKFKQVEDVLAKRPKGTGLGLSICKQIIEHHKGRIWVDSEPGKGSDFSFSLPYTL
ncbi:MAG: ATP-binding protein [Candidatus Scalindua sp.]|jgi:PAS domain S-box-containing protein